MPQMLTRRATTAAFRTQSDRHSQRQMPQMLTRRATTAAFRTQSDRRDLTTNINNQRSQAHAPDSSSYMHKCLWDRAGRTTAAVGEWKQKRRAKYEGRESPLWQCEESLPTPKRGSASITAGKRGVSRVPPADGARIARTEPARPLLRRQ